MAAGSVARTLPIPGLAEHGIGFKNVGEAIYLRNHVLARLDAASSTDDPEVRRRALTFTFVGGGYAGVEAFAELEDMARYAIEHYYPRLSPSDMRWVLVEAMGRILPEVDLDMAAWTVKQLIARDMDVRLNTRLESISDDGVVRLSDGEEFPSETLVWTAGTKPNPMLDPDRPAPGRPRPAGVRGDPAGARHARRVGGRRPGRRPRPHHGRARAPPPRPTPSTPSGRPGGWPTTSSRSWPASSRCPTGTSTSARSPASACTRAWRRSTA